MKKTLATIAAVSCATAFMPSAFADDTPTQIVAETLYEDGSTNTWTQTDLTDALGLMNRKYHRDIETESGRTQWHGKKMGQYLIEGTQDTGQGTEGNGPLLVTLYEDGFAWTSTPTRVTLKDPEAAAKIKAAAEARQAEWERTHLPPDVAALLQRRREAGK